MERRQSNKCTLLYYLSNTICDVALLSKFDQDCLFTLVCNDNMN